VSASRPAAGILFHTTGPATEKALCHCMLSLVNFHVRQFDECSLLSWSVLLYILYDAASCCDFNSIPGPVIVCVLFV